MGDYNCDGKTGERYSKYAETYAKYRHENGERIKELKKLNYGNYQIARLKWISENRSKWLQYRINTNHRRRVALTNATCTLSTSEWEQIKREHKYRCYYCKKKKVLTIDHVIPISKGGEHTKANVVPACISCNMRKGSKMLLLL